MRRLFSANLLLLIIFNLFGCGGGGGSSSGGGGGNSSPNGGGNTFSNASTVTIVQSNLGRDKSPMVSSEDLTAVVAGNTAFALNVFPLLAAAPNNNTFFSPYSITMAFALLAPGALGPTLSGIEQALSFTLSQNLLNPALNELDLLITGEATGAVINGIATPMLNIANSIWSQKGMTILPSYLDTLATNYGAGVRLVDFEDAPEVSRQAINNWVATQTNNKIQNLIPSNGVTNETRFVLTNAMWFNANWVSPFLPSATTTQSFTNRDGTISSVPFMSQAFEESSSTLYGNADGCQAIDIPYVGNKISMLIIMPNTGTFDSFLTSLTPTVITDITNNLTTYGNFIKFSMPKFSFTGGTYNLNSILQSLGMTDAFNSADFSGIDGMHDLFVQSVFHQAFISVDEFGTEASAATAVTIISGVAAPTQPPLTLSINNPFIFIIRDRSTGLILFMGKVVNLNLG